MTCVDCGGARVLLIEAVITFDDVTDEPPYFSACHGCAHD